MAVFVDTSGLYAVIDRAGECHAGAAATWRRLVEEGETLLTSSYVIQEAFALVGRHLGLEAVQLLHNDIVPSLRVRWIGLPQHERGVAFLLARHERDLSLVDCVSFDLMRGEGIDTAFAFDRHFDVQGFSTIP